jgi:carbonic anhydrase/acetyltransferase-like protein (isoleucine patch superfamily)
MSRALTASERDALTRLAASLPKGSAERRAILAGLLEATSRDVNIPGMHIIEPAEVKDHAKIYENAEVYGNALVYENAEVYGDARVHENAKVFGNAHVFDSADVAGHAKVFGHALVYENAVVSYDAQVYGKAQVFGRAKVAGRAIVYGTAKIGGSAVILGGAWDGSEGPIMSGTWGGPSLRVKAAKNTSMNFLEAHMKEAAEDVLSKFRGVVVSPYLTVIGDRWNIALTVRTPLFRDFKLMFRGKSNVFMDEGETINGLLSRAFGARLSWQKTTAEGYLFYLEAANTVDYVEEFIRETVEDAVWDVNSSAEIKVYLDGRIEIVVKTDTLEEIVRTHHYGSDPDTEEGETLVEALTDALHTKVEWTGTDLDSYNFVVRL